MGIIRENGVERDFLRDSLYRQGDQVIAKKIGGATKFNTDLIPFTLVSWYFIMCFRLPFAPGYLVPLLCVTVCLSAPVCFPSCMSFVYIDDGDQFLILLAIPCNTNVTISFCLICTFNVLYISCCISMLICSILKSPDIQSSPAIVFTNCSAILYAPVLFTTIIISPICCKSTSVPGHTSGLSNSNFTDRK